MKNNGIGFKEILGISFALKYLRELLILFTDRYLITLFKDLTFLLITRVSKIFLRYKTITELKCGLTKLIKA